MRELICDGTLKELSAMPGLAGLLRDMRPASEAPLVQDELFVDVSPRPETAVSGYAAVPPELFELSVTAYNAAFLALLSEPPSGVPGETVRRFCRKVCAAAEAANGGKAKTGLDTPAARFAADNAAADRGDDDVRAVLTAAAKVTREIDRLHGMLRFSPNDAGMYLARCAPDHFVLPTLAGHFELRFGETPWAIVDEKRRLALVRLPGEECRMVSEAELAASSSLGPVASGNTDATGEAAGEELWRIYHRSVNNENRKNPNLQRQFMPIRYWKYLTEMGGDLQSM
jgi:probable DNA metabolism protein